MSDVRWNRLNLIVNVAAAVAGTWMGFQLLRMMQARTAEQAAATAAVKKKLLLASGRTSMPALNATEESLLAEVVFPDQISCSFADVGGHIALKRALFDSVIMPLQQSELFEQLQGKNNLLSVPSGILFYGPPGTGKTLVAKAIAKTTKCTFINVRPSTLQNKWFGESQKLIRALFSLANKLAPSIIFLDEADSFMRKRGAMQQDHEAASSMRAEFLALCDGLLTDPQKGKSVTILACTNRPFDLDEAFLRRLPRTFLFDLPTQSERVAILQTFLSTHRLSEDVTVEKIASLTDKYSGSDLKEVCKIAASRPLRRLIKKHMKGEYDRVMASKGSTAAASSSAAAASTDEVDSRHSVMEPASATSDSSISSADAAVLAAAGLSSTSSAAVLALSTSRPIRLSDFRHAIHAIRPTGVEMLVRLKQFEAQHRVGTAPAAEQLEGDDSEDDEDSDGEAHLSGHDDAGSRRHSITPSSDEDEIYR